MAKIAKQTVSLLRLVRLKFVLMNVRKLTVCFTTINDLGTSEENPLHSARQLRRKYFAGSVFCIDAAALWIRKFQPELSERHVLVHTSSLH